MELKRCGSISKTRGSIPNHGYATRFKLQLVRCSYLVSSSAEVSTTNVNALLSKAPVGGTRTNKKRKRQDGKEHSKLPKDVLVSILLLLPAKLLHDVMRHTCSEWYNIIKDPCFIRAHSQLSSFQTTGFLVHDRTHKKARIIYVEGKVTEFSFTKLQLPFPGTVLSSCRGIALLHDRTNTQLLHLVNFVTKSVFTLPPVPVTRSCPFTSNGLAFSSCGHTKVVHVTGSIFNDKPAQLLIYTIGIDNAWRRVGGDSLVGNRKFSLINIIPYSIAGYIYWWYCKWPFGLALDVSTETIYEYTVPEDYTYSYNIHDSVILYLESTLGFGGYNFDKKTWEIFELTDLKSSKWNKICVISLSYLLSELSRMFYPRRAFSARPLLGMKNGDFWFESLVDAEYALVCYNPEHGYVLPCPLDKVCLLGHKAGGKCRPYPHVNSLLSFKNC